MVGYVPQCFEIAERVMSGDSSTTVAFEVRNMPTGMVKVKS